MTFVSDLGLSKYTHYKSIYFCKRDAGRKLLMKLLSTIGKTQNCSKTNKVYSTDFIDSLEYHQLHTLNNGFLPMNETAIITEKDIMPTENYPSTL